MNAFATAFAALYAAHGVGGTANLLVAHAVASPAVPERAEQLGIDRKSLKKFLSLVQYDGPDACWPYRGSLMAAGYGRIKVARRAFRAHRLAYQLLRGPVADGLHVDHQCHNADKSCTGGDACPHRACCNPWHLDPTTAGENIRRGQSPTGRNVGKTHCKYGHELTDANVQINRRGNRRCKPCAGLSGRGQGWRGARTHCPQGHEFDEKNTRVSNGVRACRACALARYHKAKGQSRGR